MSKSRASLSGRIIAPLTPFALVIALLAVATPAHAAFPGANGKIVFVSLRDGNAELYTMNGDGSVLTRLTATSAYESSPSWSADGSKIAFDRERPTGESDIWVMNADGSGERPLTSEPGISSGDPVWSPDGTKIAFTRKAPGETTEIYSIDSDGTSLVNLSKSPDTDDREPAWSPDGSKIAFTRITYGGRFGIVHIYSMNADGSNQVDLSTSGPSQGGQDDSPSWSPDGTQIAFMSRSGRCCGYGIYVMNADGSGVRGVPVPASDHPAWSPDGSRIAFNDGCSPGCPDNEVYTVNVDGSGLLKLTGNDAFDGLADWQPLVNRPPDCSGVTATPSLLSPADRRLRLVSLGGASNPDGDAVNLTITGVTQDEPLTGDGDNTGQDAFSKYFTSDPNLASLLENKQDEVYLRAESSRHGDGRVYRIGFTGSDGRGGICSGTTTVRVPSRKGLTVDSAPPSYNSFGQ